MFPCHILLIFRSCPLLPKKKIQFIFLFISFSMKQRNRQFCSTQINTVTFHYVLAKITYKNTKKSYQHSFLYYFQTFQFRRRYFSLLQQENGQSSFCIDSKRFTSNFELFHFTQCYFSLLS